MTVLFFAGGEVETLTRALLDNGAKRILYSYWYILQMRRESFIAKIQDEYKDVQFMLDSGAFTYWAKFEREPEALMPWRTFKKRYFTYIDDTWDRWCRIAELDLDGSCPEVTIDLVADWRDEMFDRWPTAPIMPVWHLNRGPEDWTSYVRDPRVRYLAVGSGMKDIGLHRRMVMEARMRNKLVHGFGMTKVNTMLPYIPYDSVDSTSWLMGQKYGTLFVFANNKFRLIGKDGTMGKGERKLYRTHFKRIGIDWKKIEADDVAEVRKANILAWRRLSDRLEYMRKLQRRTLIDEGLETRTVLNESFPVDPSIDRPLTERTVYARQRTDSSVGSVNSPKERTEADYAPGKYPREREPSSGPTGRE